MADVAKEASAAAAEPPADTAPKAAADDDTNSTAEGKGAPAAASAAAAAAADSESEGLGGALAAAAAAGADALSGEGVAEVGWKMPAQWNDGSWKPAEVIHKQINEVTQLIEYYVHYVDYNRCPRLPPTLPLPPTLACLPRFVPGGCSAPDMPVCLAVAGGWTSGCRRSAWTSRR